MPTTSCRWTNGKRRLGQLLLKAKIAASAEERYSLEGQRLRDRDEPLQPAARLGDLDELDVKVQQRICARGFAFVGSESLALRAPARVRGGRAAATHLVGSLEERREPHSPGATG